METQCCLMKIDDFGPIRAFVISRACSTHPTTDDGNLGAPL
jgi:hypothetical protein